MSQPSPSLASPAQLLEMLSKQGDGGDEPRLEELMGTLQSMQAGAQGTAAPPPVENRVEVFPEPGFVIKTTNEQGQKVFINVCGSSKLPLPPGWKPGEVPPEVKQHIEEATGGEAPPSMRFPLAMSPPRLDHDKKGAVCMVVDCLTHSEILARCADYRPLKFFLISLALVTVANRTDQELDPRYKLPKMRYKGDVPVPQQIRGDAFGDSAAAAEPQRPGSGGKRLIAELPAKGDDDGPSFALLANKRQQRQRQAANKRQVASGDMPCDQGEVQPAQAAAQEAQQEHKGQEHEQARALEQLVPQIEYFGKPALAVTITVPLPAAVAATVQRSPAAISTSLCAETVRVQAPGCRPLEMQLPFAVTSKDATAEVVAAAAGDKASSNSSSLVLHLPFQPFSGVLAELRWAASTADGMAQHGSPQSSSLTELD